MRFERAQPSWRQQTPSASREAKESFTSRHLRSYPTKPHLGEVSGSECAVKRPGLPWLRPIETKYRSHCLLTSQLRRTGSLHSAL